MKAILTASAAIVPMAAALLLIGPMRSEARDYGHAGQTFPVIEPDLLSTIEARLRGAEASGELARDRQSVEEGKSGSVSVNLGGRRCVKKKNNKEESNKKN